MKKSVKYNAEMRERAVRMMLECRPNCPSEWAAIESITAETDCAPQTRPGWLRQSQRDSGQRTGLTTAEQQQIKDLGREVRERRKVMRFCAWSARFPPKRSSAAASNPDRICRAAP